MSERLAFKSAGAVRKRETAPMLPLNLHVETLALARKFKAEADRLDTVFTQTCDPRALQGGAICEEADIHRRFARKLFDLAREIEEA